MKGRFPANLLVSDDILNDGKMRIAKGKPINQNKSWWTENKKSESYNRINDSGSYSRYFDLDIWWEEKQRR